MSALDNQMKKHDETCNVEMRKLDLDDCDCGTKEAIAELFRLKEELSRVVTVLCETRKHTGKRPCKFCSDMHLHKYPVSHGLAKRCENGVDIYILRNDAG